jgi:hypothetical protein
MDNARRRKLNQKKEEELQFRAVEIRNFLGEGIPLLVAQCRSQLRLIERQLDMLSEERIALRKHAPAPPTENAHITLHDNKIAISCPKHGCAGITGHDDRQFCIACGADITEEITQAAERMQ